MISYSIVSNHIVSNSFIIVSYSIRYFPIGINKAEYLPPISFSISKYGSKELALKTAIEHLEEIKKKYNYIEENIKIVKTDDNIISANEKKEKHFMFLL